MRSNRLRILTVAPSCALLLGLAAPALALASSGPVQASAPTKHSTVKPAPKPAYPSYNYYPVTSQMSVNPFSGPPNQPVTVTGKWFYYNQKLTLYWDTRTHVLATVTTDGTGAFSVVIRPPDDFVGNHTICLQQASWVPCQVFGLLPRVPATVQMDPAQGQPGTSVTFSGQNFNAGQQVNLVWGSSGKPLGTLIADPAGNVQGHFDIPEARSGSYQVCLAPVQPAPNEQPACKQVTVEAIPVAAVNQQSAGLTQVFTYLIILMALGGGLLFFLASRRRPAELPNATIEHRVGPPVMTSTHREFWESLSLGAPNAEPVPARPGNKGALSS